VLAGVIRFGVLITEWGRPMSGRRFGRHTRRQFQPLSPWKHLGIAGTTEGIPQSFFPFLALNVLILLAIPIIGLHYLADVLAGAVVALISVWIAGGVIKKNRF